MGAGAILLNILTQVITFAIEVMKTQRELDKKKKEGKEITDEDLAGIEKTREELFDKWQQKLKELKK
jgi:hypothetical protein